MVKNEGARIRSVQQQFLWLKKGMAREMLSNETKRKLFENIDAKILEFLSADQNT